MTKRYPSGLVASVRQRLLNMTRETGEDASLVWSAYAAERLLYRLSVSEYRRDFVLKGAALFRVWVGQRYRPTRDIDLLGYGGDTEGRIRSVFCSVCQVPVEPDGLVFDPDSVAVVPIRGSQTYGGQRVSVDAFLGKSLIPVRIDVAFGDAVTPQPEDVTYPTLLEFPAPRLRASTRETTVAEKLHAMVERGALNSRMKDFHDVHVLARDFAFDGAKLATAITATFGRRGTAIPQQLPLALTGEFGRDATKQTQWRAFVRRAGAESVPTDLHDVLAAIALFLGLALRALRAGEAFGASWGPGGPWR